MEPLTVGVEEEFLVVERGGGDLVPRSHELYERARPCLGPEVSLELNRCQIEIGTPVCTTLDEISSHLSRLRASLDAAAEPLGTAIAAVGSHPFSSWRDQEVDTTNDRFSRMDDVYQIVARQQVICGCHVHVGIPDPDLAISVMNRARPWLAPLLALTANSPFWSGLDSGFDSYRLQVWQRWPTSGMPPELEDRKEYDSLVDDLTEVDAIEDATFLYWYMRPSERYDTLEFRIADVCLCVDDAVALAGLVRALVWTCAVEALDGEPAPDLRPEIMESGVWRAARYGLAADLVSPVTTSTEPAAVVVGELLDFIGEGLRFHGDGELVNRLVDRILAEGNGASRQRRARAERGSDADVMSFVIDETQRGPS